MALDTCSCSRHRRAEHPDGIVPASQVVCHTFLSPNNHYHLVIETPDANRAKGTRQLNGVYTPCFNRHHGHVGHVFQGRYQAILVDRDAYLLELARYVVLNPVRADMVTSPQQWRWSSYHATGGQVHAPEWLVTSGCCGSLGRGPQAHARYTQFVREAQTQPSIWHDLRNQMCWGDERL